MWTAWDLTLASLVTLGLPLRALVQYRALTAMSDAEAAERRPSFYRRAMLSQWFLALLVAVLWIANARPAWTLGLTMRPTAGMIGTGLGLLFVLPAMLRQRTLVGTDPALRARIADRLVSAERILPRSNREHAWFIGLALTAGFCEELLFRGFLVWLATRFVPLLPAHAIVAVLFGVGHVYQGRKGMIRTGLVGAFFSGVMLVSGSIVPAMVMHALIDLLAGDLGRRVFAAPPVADLGRTA